jgi:hypothetical protein
MEEQFDAVLYLGPPSTMTVAKLSPALCADRGYMEMRLGRLAIIAPPPGAPFLPADRLREYCANPAGNAEIADSKPKFAELIRQTLRDAAQGKVDPAGIAPESRDRLIPFLQNIGTRFLGPAGALESLTLLADTSDAEKRVRRYRAVFASGQKMILTVSLSSTDTILSLDPRPE